VLVHFIKLAKADRFLKAQDNYQQADCEVMLALLIEHTKCLPINRPDDLP
jgi:hypothetical protein